MWGVPKILIIIILASVSTPGLFAQEHPNMTLTKAGVELIRDNLDSALLFKATLERVITEVDAEIEIGVQVPVPKDMAGGYTHERHKRNFFILQKAGNLYQITGKEKYAKYIKDNFMAYAKMYPTLPLHPTNRSYATGKIFWQCLNDSNWLVYCSQAYDCIYDFLNAEERTYLETTLFRPMADFLSLENPRFFNRIHNHSTWANAAVGMMGLAMKDEELIERALYGLKDDGIDASMVDNDGGYIKTEGVRRAGFLAQLDLSFSPDGHFTEGPYYLRYAMTPFLLFAKSLSNAKPELKIYDYRDGILEKAVYALLYETDAKGEFFPINDAQKGMSWLAREVVAAVDIAYSDFGNDPMLLSVANVQGRVLLDQSGFTVSRDIDRGLATPFSHKSIAFVDGPEGKKGGLGILRSENDDGEEICLVMKYAAHGMGHGHFDKLSYSLYDEDGEVVQDYGAARWVNIDQKGGGRYLKENQTFAKQSIAHNTVTVNQESHYKGKVKEADAKSPSLFYFNADNEDIQIVSAVEENAYEGTVMHRTMIMLNLPEFRNPLMVDVFRIVSNENSQYDMPTWFMGHLLSTSFNYNSKMSSLNTLGDSYGYQHLWKEASGVSDTTGFQFTWYGNGKFYTQTSAAEVGDEFIFAKPGANDPEFNLRHDPVFIHRKTNQPEAIFASVIESHGTYNPVSEIPLRPFSGIKKISVLFNLEKYTVIQLENVNTVWQVLLANQNASKFATHKMEINGEDHSWEGPFKFITQKK